MKKNSKPTSRRCSTLNGSLRPALVGALAVALLGLSSLPAVATPIPPTDAIRAELREFSLKRETRFESLVSHWQKKYGTKAVPSLRALSLDHRQEDTHRYIAALALTKMSPKDAISLQEKWLADPLWMVRSAGLKSVELLSSSAAATSPLSRVAKLAEEDPALVVRSQAFSTLERLAPSRVEETALKIAYSDRNYRPKGGFRAGKADAIVEDALKSLVRLHTARGLSPGFSPNRLALLMNQAHDPKIRTIALLTIEAIQGKAAAKGGTFQARRMIANRRLAALDAAPVLRTSQSSRASAPPAAAAKNPKK